MEHTLRQLAPLDFDAVVVAEDVRAYKPDTRNFTQALQACGASPRRSCTWRSASSTTSRRPRRWDADRVDQPPPRAAPGEERPDHEWRDLWGLAEFAEERTAGG